MPASQLPISRIVNVSVSLTPAGAQAQSLSNLLLLGTSTVIDTVERFREYATLASVAADFGTSAQEYLAAAKWFSQNPQPTKLIVGRWLNAAAAGGLRGGVVSAANQSMAVWNAITNGGFKYTKDGGAETNVTGLNFSGAANMNAVASIIQAALTGVTCVWNATFNRFELTSTTLGAASAVGFLVAPTAGTNIAPTMACLSSSGGAYLFTGSVAESAVAAVTMFDNMLGQKWYALNIPSAVNSDHLAVAAFVEGSTNKHIYGITTSDGGVLVAATTTDIAYQMKQLGYQRTGTQYSSSDPHAIVSALARILTTDFNGSNTVITLKFKQEPGVVPETLNATQVAAANGKNCNVFVTYNNDTSILEQGVMANGAFVDVITGSDWLATTIQTAIYNLLYTSTTKIPQTDQGMQILTTQVEAVCSQAVVNGLLAPGVWNSGGFGNLAQGDFMPKGYYVWCPRVSSQLQNERAARIAVPIQVAAKLAGAIHSASVAITVNQ